MQIVTISGLDGSGKSTQIEMLKNYLKSQGKSFYYFHGTSSSVSSLYKIFPIFSWKKTKKKVRSDEGITKANWMEIQLRKLALLIDICRFKRSIKKLKVDYVISDRYFYDSVVNINYLETRFPSRLFAEKYIPRPDFAFYIKVSPETIMKRERKPDQGLEYLEAKEKIYENKIRSWEMIIINGERGKEEIFEAIKSKIQISNLKSNPND